MSVTVAACAEPAADEAVGETASQLSVSSWSPDNGFLPGEGDSWRGTQAATLNGVTYGVHVGTCGSWTCFPDQEENDMVLVKAGSGSRLASTVPDQSTSAKVSLAAFNGYLYMVHNGGDDGDASTWISRFNPTTLQWTENSQLPYTSFAGPPAIVAYNNLLYFIGTGPSPFQMWYATMTTAESFSRPAAIPGHNSASRPSAAVLFGKLYFAHRWGSTGDIVYGSFDGATWTAPAHIPGGAAGGAIQGLEPALAADQGILHLVHLRPTGTPYVWWTYFDGCNWAAEEVTIGAQQSTLGPSLTQGGPGVVLLTSEADSDGNITRSSTYTHPYSALPPRLPTCGIGVSP